MSFKNNGLITCKFIFVQNLKCPSMLEVVPVYTVCLETFAWEQDVSIRFVLIFIFNDRISVGLWGGCQAKLYRLMDLYSRDRYETSNAIDLSSTASLSQPTVSPLMSV